MTVHALRCRCGTLKGRIRQPALLTRCVCYCKDCQAFARFLGRPEEIMDARGGTDVVQFAPADIAFTEGLSSLACMRLTSQGMLRWYSSCCNTPIGNTIANPKVSFIGLIHNVLEHGGASLDEAFGPVDAVVNTTSALAPVRAQPLRLLGVVLKFAVMLTRARLGKRPPSPFLSPAGVPVTTPKVLTSGERERVRNATF